MLKLELHYDYSLYQIIILAFDRSHISGFLVFGVLNIRDLAFNTHDATAVRGGGWNQLWDLLMLQFMGWQGKKQENFIELETQMKLQALR